MITTDPCMTTNDIPESGGVVCAMLMPHAPVLVPAVGAERCAAVKSSCLAMQEVSARLLGNRPESVVLISPHSPRQSRAFGIWEGERLLGSFTDFDAPQLRIDLPSDTALIEAITSEAASHGLLTWRIPDQALDRGALVPLWFLTEAGWRNPTVVVSLNDPQRGDLTGMGQTIAAAAKKLRRRVGVVASGDLSHRLTINAPCGFHPQARQFDKRLLQLVRKGDYRNLARVDPAQRELAAEDAVDSAWIAAAASEWQNNGHELLSYECPYGVGYGVAILFTAGSGIPGKCNPRKQSTAHSMPALARQSVTAALQGRLESPKSAWGGYFRKARPVFVTLRSLDGSLRGCAGTLSPVCGNLAEEIWRSARLAAFQDTRFPPVDKTELANLRFEVSVLHPLEPVLSSAELDPARYGVVISTEDGRRGLLLPGIPEIKDPEEQLNAVRHKGGIGWDEAVKLQRFEVDHFKEDDEGSESAHGNL